jgi:hypothetical protein
VHCQTSDQLQAAADHATAMTRLRHCEAELSRVEADECATPAQEQLRRERLLTLYANAKYCRETAWACSLMAEGKWMPPPPAVSYPALSGGERVVSPSALEVLVMRSAGNVCGAAPPMASPVASAGGSSLGEATSKASTTPSPAMGVTQTDYEAKVPKNSLQASSLHHPKTPVSPPSVAARSASSNDECKESILTGTAAPTLVTTMAAAGPATPAAVFSPSAGASAATVEGATIAAVARNVQGLSVAVDAALIRGIIDEVEKYEPRLKRGAFPKKPT